MTLPEVTASKSSVFIGSLFVRFWTISLAFQTLISPLINNSSRTSSNISCGASAAFTTFLACSVMWPFWIPSVDKAFRAEKFWASPTAAITPESSVADSRFIILRFNATAGFDSMGAPTIPTFNGSSIEPIRSPFSSFFHSEREEYLPCLDA